MTSLPQTYTEDRVGFDRRTGQILKGWPHCAQSIDVILTTRINSRVMLLDFGCDATELLDRPGNQQVIAKVFVAIYTALTRWEPGFKLTRMTLLDANRGGAYRFGLQGLFYPRGHLGDFTLSYPVETTVNLILR